MLVIGLRVRLILISPKQALKVFEMSKELAKVCSKRNKNHAMALQGRL